MAITEISVSKIYVLATEPTNKVKDRFWFDTTNNLLKRYDGTSWKPISVSSDDVVVLSSGNKVSLTNYLNTQIAALAEGIDSKQDKLKLYSEAEGNGYPSNVYGKYATINTSADSGGSSIVNINTKSLYEGNSEINLHADNTYNASLISLSAHSGDDSESGHSKIALAAVHDTYDGSQITKSYNSNIDVDCKSITLSSNALSIKLDGYSQSTSGIYINGELRGSSISTSIPVSNAVDTKVVSEKAVKTELDKKQDKLLYYSEVSGDNPSVTISVKNIKLDGSVAEGFSTTASGSNSHAEGWGTTASGDYSHAEGINTTASGDYSHAEGSWTTASISYSHAEGYRTTASSNYQHVQGKYNIEDANDKYANIIGNGSANNNRSNAQTVSWDGITWSQTDVRAGGTDQDNATYSLAALAESKQDKLTFYHEDTSSNQEASIQSADSFSIKNTNQGLILNSNNGGITITNNNFNVGQGIISINGNNWKNNSDPILFDIDGNGVKISDALKIPEIKNKQNSTDNTLETIDKTIVGAINEINSIFNVNALPTPITDVKTITTTLENLITDTQYANKPGTILINPNIKNTGAILVGEAITDISKAFPIYTDQPVTIAFKNINDFKVAGENAGESFNYIISFGYINQPISTNA